MQASKDDDITAAYEIQDFIQVEDGQSPVLALQYQTIYHSDGRIIEKVLYRLESAFQFGWIPKVTSHKES